MPSPQSIVYLLALPVALIVSVLTSGLPPVLLSTVKSTSLTKVSLYTFNTASLILSIASDTFSVFDKLVTAPCLVTDVLPS